VICLSVVNVDGECRLVDLLRARPSARRGRRGCAANIGQAEALFRVYLIREW
jgi:hypothetical protein